MQVPLRITLRNMPASEALDSRIRDQVTKLGELDARIIGCHVVIEEKARHKLRGREFNVRIALQVPGHELVVNRDHDEDVYVALRDAFHSLSRRLEDVARRGREKVGTHVATPGEEAAPPLP